HAEPDSHTGRSTSRAAASDPHRRRSGVVDDRGCMVRERAQLPILARPHCREPGVRTGSRRVLRRHCVEAVDQNERFIGPDDQLHQSVPGGVSADRRDQLQVLGLTADLAVVIGVVPIVRQIPFEEAGVIAWNRRKPLVVQVPQLGSELTISLPLCHRPSPAQLPLPRDQESSATAPRITAPWKTCCHIGFTSSRLNPFPISVTRRTPNSVRHTAPSPPLMLVPPMRIAAIALISRPIPASAWPVATRDADRTPAVPAASPLMTKVIVWIRLTRTPDSLAASELPPTA